MSALAAEHITLDDDTVRLAHETRLSSGASLVLRHADGSEIELPVSIQHMLMDTLESVAANGSASLRRMPEELTSTTAADVLSVSRPTLMKWVREGKIQCFKVGSHTRFKRADVVRLRDQRAAERQAAFEALREDLEDWD